MEFGFQMYGSYDVVLDAARFAEERGLAAIKMVDHYLMSHDMEYGWDLPAYDAWTFVAALTRDTSTVELGSLVSPVTFRHPAVIAKAATTLHELSGGRFKLGLGAGWLRAEHDLLGIEFPPPARRFDLLEETLGYLSAAFDPAAPGFEGEIYRLGQIRFEPLPAPPVPILVGGGGPRRVPRLAGTYASEFNVVDFGPLEALPHRIDGAREAARKANRDPDELLISTQLTMAGGDNAAEVEDAIGFLAAETGATRDEIVASIAEFDLPIGTWDQVGSALERWESRGVSRVYRKYWEIPWDREEAYRFFRGIGL